MASDTEGWPLRDGPGPRCPIPVELWEEYAQRLRKCLVEAGYQPNVVNIDDDLGPGIKTSETVRGRKVEFVPEGVASLAMEVAGVGAAWRKYGVTSGGQQ